MLRFNLTDNCIIIYDDEYLDADKACLNLLESDNLLIMHLDDYSGGSDYEGLLDSILDNFLNFYAVQKYDGRNSTAALSNIGSIIHKLIILALMNFDKNEVIEKIGGK